METFYFLGNLSPLKEFFSTKLQSKIDEPKESIETPTTVKPDILMTTEATQAVIPYTKTYWNSKR